jgi:hypothetical protein
MPIFCRNRRSSILRIRFMRLAARIAVFGFIALLDLYADGAASEIFRGAERGAAAHEWVEDNTSGMLTEQRRNQGYRFFVGMWYIVIVIPSSS